MPGTLTGTILNHENVGKGSDELVAMWDEAYLADQMLFLV